MRYNYCDQCDFKDTQKENILNHVENEHIVINNKCDFCEFKATTTEDLVTHVQIVHQVTNFSCNICNFKTVQKISLQYHMKSYHNDKTHISCVECKRLNKPNDKIETKELFECFDCELYCCQNCKNTIKYQEKAQQYLKITFEPHQFMCNTCVKSNFKRRSEELEDTKKNRA